jgi:Lsr2
MAQKVQVILVDDVDGGEAAETVSFALDGVSYEIDVSEKNANGLRDALAPWVGHARRVGGRSSGGRSRATSSGGGSGRSRGSSGGAGSSSGGGGGGKHDLSDVRAWARENGYQVSDRGRVSSEVIAAYEKAH